MAAKKKEPAQPQAVNRLRDRMFLMNMRNSAIHRAVTEHGFERSEARLAVGQIDDGDIEEMAVAAGMRQDGTVAQAPPVEGVQEEQQDDPQAVVQGPIMDFINRIPPEVRKAIIDAILRLIGIPV